MINVIVIYLPLFIKFALLNSTMGLLKYFMCFSLNQATCGGTLSTIRRELTNSFEIKYETRFLPINPQPASI